ncbi:MAG TPA: excinuclease ABC subunit C [Flavobacteriales bacterium]|nr:excinuclease ABC subunit C [Flavobacteriales bacterium]
MEMLVYIIQSSATGKYYVGQTKDIEERLKRHNEGRVKSTSHGLPWNLVHTIPVRNRSEALILESKIKKRGAKRYLGDLGLEF